MKEQQDMEIERMKCENETTTREFEQQLAEKSKELAKHIAENSKLTQRIERLEAKLAAQMDKSQQQTSSAQIRNSSLVEKLKQNNMVVQPPPQ